MSFYLGETWTVLWVLRCLHLNLQTVHKKLNMPVCVHVWSQKYGFSLIHPFCTLWFFLTQKKSSISYHRWHLGLDKNTVCLWNQLKWNTLWLLLTDGGGSTSASVDFTIGDENLNMGLFVLFGEVICTWFSKLLNKIQKELFRKRNWLNKIDLKKIIPKKPKAKFSPFRFKKHFLISQKYLIVTAVKSAFLLQEEHTQFLNMDICLKKKNNIHKHTSRRFFKK